MGSRVGAAWRDREVPPARHRNVHGVAPCDRGMRTRRDPHRRVRLVDERRSRDRMPRPDGGPVEDRNLAPPGLATSDADAPLADRSGRRPRFHASAPARDRRRLHRGGRSESTQRHQLDRGGQHGRTGTVASHVLLVEATKKVVDGVGIDPIAGDREGELPHLAPETQVGFQADRAVGRVDAICLEVTAYLGPQLFGHLLERVLPARKQAGQGPHAFPLQIGGGRPEGREDRGELGYQHVIDSQCRRQISREERSTASIAGQREVGAVQSPGVEKGAHRRGHAFECQSSDPPGALFGIESRTRHRARRRPPWPRRRPVACPRREIDRRRGNPARGGRRSPSDPLRPVRNTPVRGRPRRNVVRPAACPGHRPRRSIHRRPRWTRCRPWEATSRGQPALSGSAGELADRSRRQRQMRCPPCHT